MNWCRRFYVVDLPEKSIGKNFIVGHHNKIFQIKEKEGIKKEKKENGNDNKIRSRIYSQ